MKKIIKNINVIKGILNQKEFDIIAERKGSINLTNRLTTKQVTNRRKINTRKRKNNSKHYFMLSFGLIMICILIINYSGNIEKVNATYSNNYYISKINKTVPKFLYDNLLIECKNQKARNINHCLKTGLSIAYAESTWGRGNISYNYFGLTSADKSIKSWVWRYNKYWYTATNGTFFYGANGKAGRSHYCMSEESSGTKGWCPNGQKNFNHIYFNF